MNLSGVSITPDMREAWLKDRANRLGASEAAAAIGISEYKTQMELWMEKTARKSRKDFKGNRYTEWGLRLEQAIMCAYAEETGHGIIASQVYLISKEHDWLCCTVDAIRDDGRIVEIKTADKDQGYKWGENHTDGVPDDYICQYVHQMKVAESHFNNVDVLDVACLIGGNDFRIYTVPKNRSLIDNIFNREHEFMKHVWSNTPPEPDIDKDAPLLVYMYPEAKGQVVFNDHMTCTVDDYMHIKQEIKNLEVLEEKFKAEILLTMGGASEAILEGGRILERKVINRSGYTSIVKPTTYAQLKMKKGK